MIKCYDCGGDGHIARDCPNAAALGADDRPPWCGGCDENTRWIERRDQGGDYVSRCPRCHPLHGRLLKQHRRCGNCKQAIYAWDQAPCDHHQPLALTARDGHRPVTLYEPGEQEISRPALRIACPWCKAGEGQQCVNVGTRLACPPHAARLELAGEDVTPAARLRELAAAQVAESRSGRPVV